MIIIISYNRYKVGYASANHEKAYFAPSLESRESGGVAVELDRLAVGVICVPVHLQSLLLYVMVWYGMVYEVVNIDKYKQSSL